MQQGDFEELLKQTMGLDTASVGSTTIGRAVRLRMGQLGEQKTEGYWQRLQDSDEELQELIEAVIVPETWFFRDREAFAVLVRLVTEEWLPAHPTSVLRLLSAPCSTGEESYSMVMALLDGGLSRDRLKVDAVDISAHALNQAKRGTYRVNSFRGEDLAFRDRYFVATAEGYSLPGWLLNLVTFRRGNLLSADFAFREEPYDVIFCRNLLIYFDRPTQQRVMSMLDSLLARKGLLFVGPAEAFLATCNGYGSVNHAMSFAFRKASPTGMALPDPPLPRMTKSAPKRARLRPECLTKEKAVHTHVPEQPRQSPMDLTAAQRLADAGRLREAAECCEGHLQQQGASSEAYYLLGLVRDALGDRQNALECYRKAVYLEPEHVEALLHLALVSEKAGDRAAAQRLRERARRIDQSTEQRIL
jgi:chemotaxis protein methyltransferase WspC